MYLDKVCKFLEDKGYTDMWGYLSCEKIASVDRYRKKLRSEKNKEKNDN